MLREEVITVKLFINNVRSGRYRFFKPDPHESYQWELDGYVERTKYYSKAAPLWLQMFQQKPRPSEFTKLTNEFHAQIQFWRSKDYVIGVSNDDETQKLMEITKEENRKLIAENKELKAHNIQLAEELAKFRRPPVEGDPQPSVTGEE